MFGGKKESLKPEDLWRLRMEAAYGTGVIDGVIVTLELLSGVTPDGHGEPYTGPVPPELARYLKDALARARSVRQ